MPVQRFAPMTKDFATFDCDAHVTEPPLIWERAAEYLTREEMEALRATIWWDGESRQLMLGFDAEERLIQKLPHDFAEKIVWGSRYPQHDTTSAHDAIAMLARADVPEDIIAGMMGGNAARQFGVELLELASG